MTAFPIRLGHVAVAASLVLGLSACQRNDPPTPGVAGGTANPPSSAASEPATAPVTNDAQVGRGKSPGKSGQPDGMTGSGGTAPAPTAGADPHPPGQPAIPPADAPGTAVPVPPANPPASR